MPAIANADLLMRWLFLFVRALCRHKTLDKRISNSERTNTHFRHAKREGNKYIKWKNIWAHSHLWRAVAEAVDADHVLPCEWTERESRDNEILENVLFNSISLAAYRCRCQLPSHINSFLFLEFTIYSNFLGIHALTLSPTLSTVANA